MSDRIDVTNLFYFTSLRFKYYYINCIYIDIFKYVLYLVLPTLSLVLLKLEM